MNAEESLRYNAIANLLNAGLETARTLDLFYTQTPISWMTGEKEKEGAHWPGFSLFKNHWAAAIWFYIRPVGIHAQADGYDTNALGEGQIGVWVDNTFNEFKQWAKHKTGLQPYFRRLEHDEWERVLGYSVWAAKFTPWNKASWAEREKLAFKDDITGIAEIIADKLDRYHEEHPRKDI